MDQFIHLSEFRVIICKKCQYAILPSEIDAHFAREPVHGLSKESRRLIFDRVTKVEGLIRNRTVLSQVGFKYPPLNTTAIPGLAKPKIDGLGCPFEKDGERCRFVHWQEQKMREHCQDIHQWKNPRKRGGQCKDDPKNDVPWKKRVHCQRFFIQGLYSSYFEVEHQAPTASGPESPEVKMEKEI